MTRFTTQALVDRAAGTFRPFGKLLSPSWVPGGGSHKETPPTSRFWKPFPQDEENDFLFHLKNVLHSCLIWFTPFPKKHLPYCFVGFSLRSRHIDKCETSVSSTNQLGIGFLPDPSFLSAVQLVLLHSQAAPNTN